MEAPLFPSGQAQTCKWCNVANAKVVFENAAVCSKCYQKGIEAVQNQSLCEICSSLFLEKEKMEAMLSEYGLQHCTAMMLEKRTENGCGLCRIFLLQDPNPDSQRLDFIPLYLSAGIAAKPSPRGEEGEEVVKDISSLSFSSQEGFVLTVSVSALPGDPAAKYISQRPVETDLGSENTILQIRNWLDECGNTHSESMPSEQDASQQPFFPTRVIDVGLHDGDEVKLFEPSTPTHDRYVALSYCWGTTPFRRTLNENIEAHKQKLDMSTLPQTFKDAIVTTRRLGFCYVWIDALCIIQDSGDDKMKEISTMEKIYSEASLTIAIVSHSSVISGFLKSKPALTVQLPYRCPGGEMGSVIVQSQKSVDMWQEPLYTRAWCLQENLLSERMLLYTDMEVVWQCPSAPVRRLDTLHVVYEYDDPELGNSPFRRLPKDLDMPEERMLQEEGAQKDAELQERERLKVDEENYKTWRHVVKGYMRRNLSVASDRLPALAGVAQKFKDAWGDEYCAGLWKRQFIPSLAWRRTDQYLPDCPYPLEDYRAPSWSWASLEGPIEFGWRFDLGNAYKLGAKLISCDVEPVSPELAPLGEVKSGRAVFEAYVIGIREMPMNNYTNQNKATDGGRLFLDQPSLERWPWFGTQVNLERMGAWEVMLLGEGRSGSGKMMESTALVLSPAEESDFGGEKGEYKREGLWVSSTKGASKAWMGKGKRRTVIVV